MGLQLEAADERRHRCTRLRGGCAVRSPAGSERFRNDGTLVGREGKVCLDSPGVAILRVQGGGLVVGVETVLVVPEKFVCYSLDPGRSGGPVPDGCVVIEGLGERDGIVEDVVQNRVGFDVLFLLALH